MTVDIKPQPSAEVAQHEATRSGARPDIGLAICCGSALLVIGSVVGVLLWLGAL